ncbi:MAG: hypothetical protein IKR04_03030 [Clostridia bacterium]|nr:hypothetical protein [Clostridia bacterium]
MQVVKRILKEVFIAFIMVGLIVLIGFLLFRNHFTFLSTSVPNAVKYDRINLADYGVVSEETSLENQKDPTKKYEATNKSLRTMTDERRVSTGAPNPFVTSDEVETDIPTEVVTIANELSAERMALNSGDSATN